MFKEVHREVLNDKGAKRILELVRNGDYNIDRPDALLILELLNLIVYLDKRLKKLE